MGGPAAGKSSAYDRLGPSTKDGYVYINVDLVRERLPEYREMADAGDLEAAAITHDEASDIAKHCVDVARRLGRNLVVDAVGKDDRGQLSATVSMLLDDGYSVLLRCVTVPVAIAEKREKERAERTGRMVPAAELRRGHREVSRAFQTVAELPGVRIELYETSGPEPRLIAEKADSDLEVIDAKLYDEFLKKGDD
jgi:chloramphenicol 3-O-phosphotransferase